MSKFCGFSRSKAVDFRLLCPPKTMEFPQKRWNFPKNHGISPWFIHFAASRRSWAPHLWFLWTTIGQENSPSTWARPPKNRIWQEMIGTWSFKRFKASSLGGFSWISPGSDDDQGYHPPVWIERNYWKGNYGFCMTISTISPQLLEASCYFLLLHLQILSFYNTISWRCT